MNKESELDFVEKMYKVQNASKIDFVEKKTFFFENNPLWGVELKKKLGKPKLNYKAMPIGII